MVNPNLKYYPCKKNVLWYYDKVKVANMNQNDTTPKQNLISLELNISDTNAGINWSSIWLSYPIIFDAKGEWHHILVQCFLTYKH